MSIKEKAQKLWCQHCKALQKTNKTAVECWYNPLNTEEKAFCVANEDAVTQILKLLKVEAGKMLNSYKPDGEYLGYRAIYQQAIQDFIKLLEE